MPMMNKNYSLKIYLYRLLWALGQIFYKFLPNCLWGLRHFILKCYGAKIGRNSKIYSSVKIAFPFNLIVGENTCIGDNVILYNLGLLEVGSNVTISQGAHLCGGTHDYKKRDDALLMPLVKSDILIKDGVWICADAFIGPGVIISENSIIGARSVIFKDVPGRVIVAGNPGQVIKNRYG